MMHDPTAIRGSIVLGNAAGRALRKAARAVCAADVIYSGGGFRAGDAVFVTFRGDDGGQHVVATAIVRCDAAELNRRIDLRADGPAAAGSAADEVVAREEDVALIWPPW